MTTHDKPLAVLWDMDGTLIDSEPYWMSAETTLATQYGVTWTHEDAVGVIGKPLPVSAQVLIDHGVNAPADVIIDALLTSVAARIRQAVPWQDDARTLLDAVVAAGIPCALVTMSYGPVLDAFFAAAPPVFDVIVPGDQMEHGKPHPEGYLTAAQRLGVDITRCVAIEDSPGGVSAAYDSGAQTIAVQRLAPVNSRPRMTRVQSLAHVTVDTLAAVAAGEHWDEGDASR